MMVLMEDAFGNRRPLGVYNDDDKIDRVIEKLQGEGRDVWIESFDLNGDP